MGDIHCDFSAVAQILAANRKAKVCIRRFKVAAKKPILIFRFCLSDWVHEWYDR